MTNMSRDKGVKKSRESLLEGLKNKNLVWQGSETSLNKQSVTTGFPELDYKLHGGWPANGVIEMTLFELGIGELRLLVPLIKQNQCSLTVLISPPFHINSAFLLSQGIQPESVLIVKNTTSKNALWSAEKCLKSGCCQQVLIWQSNFENHQIKRLKLAAEQGQSCLFIYNLQDRRRPALGHKKQSLAVNLSISLKQSIRGLGITIDKHLAYWPQDEFVLDMSYWWPELTHKSSHSNVVPIRRAG